MADQLEQLKQKYQAVLNLIPQLNVQLHHVNMDGGKLYIQGTAPSEDAKNQVWNQIKLVDPSYSDLTADFDVAPQTAAPAPAPEAGHQRTYDVKSGDTLSAISLHFYGHANAYQKIMDANNIADANHIRAGQTLIIPE